MPQTKKIDESVARKFSHELSNSLSVLDMCLKRVKCEPASENQALLDKSIAQVEKMIKDLGQFRENFK